MTNLPIIHMPLNEIYPDDSESDDSQELYDRNRGAFVDTVGCQIPIAMIPYKKYKNRQKNCGKRAVFLKKVDDGYIADNTFPNLMAALSGKNMSSISNSCYKRMDVCNEFLIWNQFKNSGYVTAYGEDYLRLPDTFSKEYTYNNVPTDHYLRPFYLHGEHELFNRSLVCTGKVTSGQHLLDYAYDFALTYRFSMFFGVFWMNTFSHNVNSYPEEADKMFEGFLNRLTYTGILENTFIIFFSDHGIRFGEYRLDPASYYEERNPAFFMWAPVRFQAHYPLLFKAAAVNQFRLITPYDLYNTLVNINTLSELRNYTEGLSEACPLCHSIFREISGNRTCADGSIHPKWCPCHKLYPLDSQDMEGMKSVVYASTKIKAMIKTIKTDRCWGCLKLAIKNVIRIHFYYNYLSLYYVVAFSMTPGNITYEAVVSKKGPHLELVGDISVISVYRGLGKCAPNQRDRLFCVCKKKENC
ncbi:unnamed protein product [Diatraea saccharalis]|uniref:Sulfatase N-terminal domain-containing protein n=1 Tax=Diatraea saccharalis TaxID=40085 RepID=A0A9N9W771_9NEOP|nr:unnamed protein product [Diatraea saccharalis]